MARLGNMYGPDATFLGVPPAELDDPASWAGTDVLIIGAPFDGGTSHRPGARFGPQAIRFTDYLPHDGSRPHLALGVDPLAELRIADAGDVEMPSGDTELSLRRLEEAVQRASEAGAIRSSSAVTIRSPSRTRPAWPGTWGGPPVHDPFRRACRHGEPSSARLRPGTPMRRLIESARCAATDPADRAARLLAEPETLAWMAEQNMRSYKMTEVVTGAWTTP